MNKGHTNKISQAYLFDYGRLKRLSSAQFLTCKTCGERYSIANPEAMFDHPLQHAKVESERAAIEKARQAFHELQASSPAEIARLLMEQALAEPTLMSRFVAEGVILPVGAAAQESGEGGER